MHANKCSHGILITVLSLTSAFGWGVYQHSWHVDTRKATHNLLLKLMNFFILCVLELRNTILKNIFLWIHFLQGEFQYLSTWILFSDLCLLELLVILHLVCRNLGTLTLVRITVVVASDIEPPLCSIIMDPVPDQLSSWFICFRHARTLVLYSLFVCRDVGANTRRWFVSEGVWHASAAPTGAGSLCGALLQGTLASGKTPGSRSKECWCKQIQTTNFY